MTARDLPSGRRRRRGAPCPHRPRAPPASDLCCTDDSGATGEPRRAHRQLVPGLAVAVLAASVGLLAHRAIDPLSAHVVAVAVGIPSARPRAGSDASPRSALRRAARAARRDRPRRPAVVARRDRRARPSVARRRRRRGRCDLPRDAVARPPARAQPVARTARRHRLLDLRRLGDRCGRAARRLHRGGGRLLGRAGHPLAERCRSVCCPSSATCSASATPASAAGSGPPSMTSARWSPRPRPATMRRCTRRSSSS